MKWTLGWTTLVFLASSTALANDIPAKNLKSAFLAAVQRSETLEIQKELRVQAQEVDTQAKGALYPSINGSALFLQQAAPKDATGNSLYPANQETGKVTLSQPLFRGLRDFAALRQKNLLVSSQDHALQNAAKQLFYDVSTAYYNVLEYQRDAANYKIEIQLNEKRLKELEGFYKIGRAQLTDVLTQKANIASLEAELETIQGKLESAKDIFAYLTGWNRETELKDDESVNSSGDIATYLSKIDERPDVRMAISNLEANEEGVPIAWGGHLPSVDLLGDYYFFRPGALRDVNWDIQLAITIPLFQGGVVQSQVRQAHSVARQYGLVLSQTRRLAEQEIRTFFDAMEADRKQVMKLSELVEVAKKNYETELQYYRNGLVTNLEVLQATTTYQDAVRQLDHIRYQFQNDGVKLQAASGQRPEMSIDLPKS